MTKSNSSPVLSYRRYTLDPAPNPLPVTRLLIPGSLCWFCYSLLFVKVNVVYHMPGFAVVGLAMWPVAVIAAISSLIVYLPRRKRKPWYVCANLVINSAGLLFTAALPFCGATLFQRV